MNTLTRLSSSAVLLTLLAVAGTTHAAPLYQTPSFTATNATWWFTAGYRFTPDKPITVTKLGGAFTGVKNVYLYDHVTGQVLASTPVTGAGSSYAYHPITPVPLAADHPYVVAVVVAGSGGNSASLTTPVTLADATIDGACAVFNASTTSSGDPCQIGSVSTTTMWGVADLVYQPFVDPPPTITGQPASLTVDAGQAADLAVTYGSPCQPVAVRWQRDGVNLSDDATYTGTHTDSLHVAGATAAQGGSYRAALSCGGKTTYSRSATLAVQATATVTTTVPPVVNQFGWSGCSAGACTLWWNGFGGAINATELTVTPAGGEPLDVTGLSQVVVYPTSSTIYTLIATNPAGSYSRNVLVPVGGYTDYITSCQTIDKPGRYRITRSMRSLSTTLACLDVRDSHDIYIDCAPGVVVGGRKAGPIGSAETTTSGAINVTNVDNFAIRGCQFRDSMPGGQVFYASFADSSMGYVFDTDFGDASYTAGKQGVQIRRSDYITFALDTIYNQLDVHGDSSGIAIVSSNLTNVFPGYLEEVQAGDPHTFTAALVGGTATRIQLVSCVLDGGATGATLPDSSVFVGADDGVDGAGSGSLFAHNYLTNFWDSALEWTKPTPGGTTVYRNHIDNAGFAPLSWNRDADMVGWLIADNYIDSSSWPAFNSPIRMHLVPNAGVTPRFQYNNFDHNQIVNGAGSQASEFTTTGGWVVGGNLFSYNNFNRNSYPGIGAPLFTEPYPPSMDGGGNVCAHPNPPGYPLVCN